MTYSDRLGQQDSMMVIAVGNSTPKSEKFPRYKNEYIPLTITTECVGLIDSVEIDDSQGNEAKILLDFRRKRQRRLARLLTDDIMTFELCN